MRHDPITKESSGPVHCPVEQLIRNDDIARGEFFAHAADSTDRDDPLHSDGLESVDICANRDLSREVPVSASMPRQECHRHPVQSPGDDRIARGAERRLHHHLGAVFKSRHVVEAAAPDNGQARLTAGSKRRWTCGIVSLGHRRFPSCIDRKCP